jgi:hypothetical protein
LNIDIPYEVDDTVEEEPSDASPVYCKRGHRMALSAFNKGGYGSEAEFGCDLCGQLKSGRRHFCILCTSDLCLDCNAWNYKASPYEYFAPDCPVVWQTQTGKLVERIVVIVELRIYIHTYIHTYTHIYASADVRSVYKAYDAHACTVEAIGLDLSEVKRVYVRFTARSNGALGDVTLHPDCVLVVNDTSLTLSSDSDIRVEKYDPQSEIKATAAFDISSVIELFKEFGGLKLKFSLNKRLGYSSADLQLPDKSTISWQSQTGKSMTRNGCDTSFRYSTLPLAPFSYHCLSYVFM